MFSVGDGLAGTSFAKLLLPTWQGKGRLENHGKTVFSNNLENTFLQALKALWDSPKFHIT